MLSYSIAFLRILDYVYIFRITFPDFWTGLYVPSSVFKACHTVIPPGPFVKSCVSDNCNSDNNTCTSLEAYATECSNEGVCIDWRNATNGRCGKIKSIGYISIGVAWSFDQMCI